jgi:hypothetical protein
MKKTLSSLAALELLMVFPAVLFITALVARSIQPRQYEPAHTAALIVDWYAARVHLGLWLLLTGLPLTVIMLGSIALMRAWKTDETLRRATRETAAALRAYFAAALIAAATLAAAAILAIVALHVATN